MDKRLIVLEIKSRILNLVNQLDENNYGDLIQKIQSYLDFLKAMENVSDLMSEDIRAEREKDSIENNDIDEKKTEGNEIEEYKGDSDRYVYRLRRLPVNGNLESLHDPAEVIRMPEGQIRRLAVSTGDLIKAIPKGDGSRYDFYLYKKVNVNDEEPHRREVKYCVIDEEEGDLYINRIATGGALIVNGIERKFVLNQYIIEKFSLEKGSIVDVAYNNGEDNLFVSWRHDSATRVQKNVFGASVLKKSEAGVNIDKEKDTVFANPAYVGKCVTVIGAVETHDNIKKLFNQHQIKYQGFEGTENEDRIEAAVRKSDLVIVVTPFTAHKGSWAARNYTKNYDVPFKQTTSYGVKTIENILHDTFINS
ncbi:DUF2325 domain-containing protein [Bacillus sp. TH008]|uniref:DUF2325 domain-containing protein n=1 Tax=Bacillus sp. TH008 TaxID=1609979 RepID=UPI000616FA87|nr:DUF2325 domain-containing protein [Bacillus sp. TH008]KKB72045.1 hypothetical protein TH62_20885 [Bacillus sp. TH008]